MNYLEIEVNNRHQITLNDVRSEQDIIDIIGVEDIEVTSWGDVPECFQAIDENLFDFVEYYERSHYDVDVFEAAFECGVAMCDVDEAYQGMFNNNESFAREMAEQMGSVDDNAKWPHDCIDWEYAAKELMYDYCEQNNHYFRNI